MPVAIPTLGYRSRSEAVCSLRAQGLSRQEVADKIGIDVGKVAALETSGYRAKRPAEASARTIVVPIDTLERLRPFADFRQISVNALVRRLLDHIADDKLVDPILDDAEGA